MSDKKIEAEKIKRNFLKYSTLLTSKEKDIVACFYGIGEQVRHSLQELGEKYQVTRERIRQIKSIALKKIKIKNEK